jgi:[acyl-carrier-protein] S-malonyltransferase
MKKSVTLLFPGQGAQYVGMGQSFNSEPFFKEIDSILGVNLTTLMLEGPVEELNLTRNTQPAILAHSVALYRRLEMFLNSQNIKISRVLGHSLGEYSALTVAGVLSFEEALKAVYLRGTYMQEAVPVGEGKMIALVNVPREAIVDACAQFDEVIPANFNHPGQTVISGRGDCCDHVVNWLKDHYQKAFKAIELKVSAPFHSPLMKPAAQALEKAFGDFHFSTNKFAYVANVDGREYPSGTDPEVIRGNLIRQVDSSVLWRQSFLKIPQSEICIEVGPGKVLKGLAKKINPQIKVLSMDSETFFDELSEVYS